MKDTSSFIHRGAMKIFRQASQDPQGIMLSGHWFQLDFEVHENQKGSNKDKEYSAGPKSYSHG